MSRSTVRVNLLLPIFLILLAACGPAKYERQSQQELTNSAPTAVAEAIPTATVEPQTSVEQDAVPTAVAPTATSQPSGSYALGSADAPVTIVEYSDFQCPFCQRHSVQTLPLLKEQFIDTGRLRYEFRDFPIASLHPFAYRLHEAAYCAGEAGGDAYWQAHALFFGQADRKSVV